MPLVAIGKQNTPIVPLLIHDRNLLTPIDAVVVSSKTTVTSAESPGYIDTTVIGTITSLVGSYLMETFTIHSTDYFWNAWDTAYSYDGSIPTYGSVGTFDDDKGFIPGT